MVAVLVCVAVVVLVLVTVTVLWQPAKLATIEVTSIRGMSIPRDFFMYPEFASFLKIYLSDFEQRGYHKQYIVWYKTGIYYSQYILLSSFLAGDFKIKGNFIFYRIYRAYGRRCLPCKLVSPPSHTGFQKVVRAWPMSLNFSYFCFAICTLLSYSRFRASGPENHHTTALSSSICPCGLW